MHLLFWNSSICWSTDVLVNILSLSIQKQGGKVSLS